MKRVHVLITGLVQGVFFRVNTRNEAIARNLTGWVKNLPDGRVEAIFEGEDADVQSMLEWCKKGPPHAIVRDVKITDKTYKGEFKGFFIV